MYRRLFTQPRDAATRWPLRCLSSVYENTSIASHTRLRHRWLILFSLGAMSVFHDLRVRWKMMQRLGAYKRGRERGLADEQARAYSDEVYPPTADDLAYETSLRDGTARPLGAPSMLALLLPIAAAVYVGRSATFVVAVGYALANLGYVLVAAAIFRGTFLALGLRRRAYVFAFAALSFIVGTVLCNIRT